MLRISLLKLQSLFNQSSQLHLSQQLEGDVGYADVASALTPCLQESGKNAARKSLLKGQFIKDYQEGVCLYTCEEIRHLFPKISLRIAWLSQQQYLMLTGDALSFANMTTTNYRYHAYRSYTSYIHGLLGRWQRKVVPACLVKRIRELYPSADDTYVGYIHVNLETGEEIPHNELEQLQMELDGKNGNIVVVLCCLEFYILGLHVPACNFCGIL